ncbi:hypothetical protein C8J57DRAFT_1318252 [Mycena rebaudengoi]|nr:hypothetical protein C8J57DRAFT_1318252 [Mycena rebaudengoi]
MERATCSIILWIHGVTEGSLAQAKGREWPMRRRKRNCPRIRSGVGCPRCPHLARLLSSALRTSLVSPTQPHPQPTALHRVPLSTRLPSTYHSYDPSTSPSRPPNPSSPLSRPHHPSPPLPRRHDERVRAPQPRSGSWPAAGSCAGQTRRASGRSAGCGGPNAKGRVLLRSTALATPTAPLLRCATHFPLHV